MAVALAALAGCATPPPPPPAPSPPSSAHGGQSSDAAAEAGLQQKAFERWVTDFRTRARAAGIDEATLNVAFAEVRYLPRVVELDRAQPEYTRTVWSYLDSAVSAQRVALGQERWAQYRSDIDAAAARFGVGPAILVAIWGIAWHKRLIGLLTGDRRHWSWLTCTFVMYFISVVVSRRVFKFVPGERMMHRVLEEALETVAHAMFIVTCLLGSWRRSAGSGSESSPADAPAADR